MASNRRRQLRQLYDQVPEINCSGQCQDACGPIDMSDTERSILRRRGVEITERTEAVRTLARTGDFTCDALVDGRCSVYEDRPMICRVWGVAESLRCPYGCTAEAVVSDEDMMVLINESLRVGGHHETIPTAEQLRQVYRDERDLVQPMLEAHRPRARTTPAAPTTST